MGRNVLRGGVQLPLGYIFEFDPTGITDAPDLSTADKVHDYFGYGTWEDYGSGRVLIGVSSGHGIGSEGGEENHTLTTDEMPRHRHDENMPVQGWSGWPEYKTPGYGVAIDYASNNYHGPDTTLHYTYTTAYGTPTSTVGGDQSHNNMQPYRTVYRWRRIA